MTNREKCLALLERQEWVTTNDFLRAGCGSRFGARLLELRKQGYVIETEPVREGQARYKLRRVGTPNDGRANSGGPRKLAEGYGGSLTGGAVDSSPRGGGRGQTEKHPAAISGLTGPEGQGNEPAGGADKGSPVARLFDLDPPVTGGYYEREAAA